MTSESLSQFLNRHQLKEADFAKTIGVTTCAVRHWTQGRRKIPHTIDKLVAFFDRYPTAIKVMAKLAVCLWFTACQHSAPSAPTPVGTPTPLTTLAWKKEAWSVELRKNIADNFPSFKKAKDWQKWCPNYNVIDDVDRAEMMAHFIVAIAKFESNYKPDTVFKEPPPLGVNSIGLFQLSYEDRMSWCDMDAKRDTLLNPLTNIQCAVGKMARLIERDGVVAEGYNKSTAKGLARYWSVTREPHGGKTHKKEQIRAVTSALPMCKKS